MAIFSTAANRIVCVGAALGVTAYVAHERYKDYQCRQEAEEEERKIRDAWEEAEERRKEEEVRQFRHENNHRSKKKNRDKRKPQQSKSDDDEDAFPTAHENWARYILYYRCELDNQFLQFLIELRKRGRKHASRQGQGRGLGYHKRLNLPLLDNGTFNSPDEMVFAAALALGEPQVVEMILEESVIKATPDLVLANITPAAIHFLAAELDALSTYGRVFEGKSVMPMSGMSEGLCKLMYHVCNSTSEPMVVPLNKDYIHRRCQLDELAVWANKLGCFLVSERALKQKGVFVDQEGSPRMHFDVVDKKSSKRFRCAPTFEDGTIYLMNFEGSFSAPLDHKKDGYSLRLPYVKTYSKNMVAPTNTQKKARIHFLARLATTKMARVAAQRLRKLLATPRDNNGEEDLTVSVEHICVAGGLEVSMLQDIKSNFLELMESNQDKVVATLTRTLEHCLLRRQSATANAEERTSTSNIKKEIAIFAGLYGRLLELSYCLVPHLHGKPPSSWVPENDVHDEAMTGILDSVSYKQKRTTRALETDERDRLVRSRTKMMPPAPVIACMTGAMLWIFYWFSLCSIKTLPWKKVQVYADFQTYSAPALQIAALFAAFTMLRGLLKNLQQPLFIRVAEHQSELQLIWATAAVLSEVVIRHWTMLKTQKTPLQHEVHRITSTCQTQFQAWKAHCAERDFQEALQRKQITCQCLDSLLDYHVQTNEDESTEQFKVPGTLSEAEEFLDVELIDEDFKNDTTKPCTTLMLEMGRDIAVTLGGLAPGTRVSIDSKQVFWREENAGANHFNSSLATVHAATGTVVSAYGSILHIQMDGKKHIFAIQSKYCHPLNNDVACMSSDEVVQEVADKARVEAVREVDGVPDGVTGNNIEELAASNAADAQKVIRYKRTLREVKVEKDNVYDVEENLAAEDETNKEPQFQRATTVKEALDAGGWVLERSKKHLVFKRRRLTDDGEESNSFEKFTMPSTPSDRRGMKNALQLLNRKNQDHVTRSKRSTTGKEKENVPCKACIICQEYKVESGFSITQLKKQESKCKACIISINSQCE